MAKGNLFLGTAARSVGDVVMYRREGSQVSRVRVRKIANPKTEAQCRQRAYMAPIPKFFSPLAVVLERSFEGLSKSKSYSKFLKVNADKARANDWLLPKGTGFFPLPYILSQGSLQSVQILEYDDEIDGNQIIIPEIGDSFTTIGDASKAFIAAGYQEGDVVSFIGVSKSFVGDNYVPESFQFILNSTDTTLLTTLGSDTFKLMHGTSGWYISSPNGGCEAVSVIVARFENNKWRRSTQVLVVKESILTTIDTDAYKAAAIASYSNTVSDGNPMVYLDGDELDNA